MDADAVADYGDKIDIPAEVVGMCPTKCISYDAKGRKLSIDNSNCTRCMHCINVMPKALRPGTDTGATILIGGKAPILMGAQLASVIFPFYKLESPYDDLKEFLDKMWDWWDENAKFRERIGEMILRVGLRTFLREMGIKPDPRMVKEPRFNPYVFWWPEDVPERTAFFEEEE